MTRFNEMKQVSIRSIKTALGRIIAGKRADKMDCSLACLE